MLNRITITGDADPKEVKQTERIAGRIESRISELTAGRDGKKEELIKKLKGFEAEAENAKQTMIDAEDKGDFERYKTASNKKTSAEWSVKATKNMLAKFDSALADEKEDRETVGKLSAEIDAIEQDMDAKLSGHIDAIREIIATGFTRESIAREALFSWNREVMHRGSDDVVSPYFGTYLSRRLNVTLNGSTL